MPVNALVDRAIPAVLAVLLPVFSSLAAAATTTGAKPSAVSPKPDELTQTIAKLDTAVFDAFNTCDKPGQLQKHSDYFAPDVEFYHDTGGVTWTRDEMIANTARNVCGHFRRELVPGSLRIFPIKDFGAIEEGTHRFCQFAASDCEGIADFVIVWRHQGEQWQITRVLSFAHRANGAG